MRINWMFWKVLYRWPGIDFRFVKDLMILKDTSKHSCTQRRRIFPVLFSILDFASSFIERIEKYKQKAEKNLRKH